MAAPTDRAHRRGRAATLRPGERPMSRMNHAISPQDATPADRLSLRASVGGCLHAGVAAGARRRPGRAGTGSVVSWCWDDFFKGETRDPHRLALRAYVWGYPLVRAAQLRENMTLAADPNGGQPRHPLAAPINRLGHARELATPDTRQGVAPNNDTLYRLAWLDMDDGPFVFETPDFGERFYTFRDGTGRHDHRCFARPTHSWPATAAGVHSGSWLTLRGPRRDGRVRSDQRYLMIAGRALVEGGADLPAAHRSECDEASALLRLFGRTRRAAAREPVA